MTRDWELLVVIGICVVSAALILGWLFYETRKEDEDDE
jgi:type II secretory pathway pseudopilin PulG